MPVVRPGACALPAVDSGGHSQNDGGEAWAGAGHSVWQLPPSTAAPSPAAVQTTKTLATAVGPASGGIVRISP